MAFMGIAFVYIKGAVSISSPFVFLFYRFLIASMVLAIIFHKHLRTITRDTILMASSCGIPLFFSILFQTIGLKYTTVANSAFITGMVVLLIPIFKMIFYKKQVRPIVWFSCILSLIGLYIIMKQNGLSFNIGDLWTGACAISLAFYVLQTGKFAVAQNPMARVTIIMVVCAIGSLFGLLTSPSSDWIPKDYSFWKGVVFTSLFGTVYMYSIQNYGQRYIVEEKVALAYLTEPIFAVLAAAYLINEEITIYTYVGGTLILIALFISEIHLGRKNQLVKL